MNDKELVAHHAAKQVKNGMLVGLGTGSTANYFIQELARRRTEEGLQNQAPIVAARYVEIEDGQLLLLWLRMANDEVELELGYDDDSSDESDDDFGFPDQPA